MNQYVVSIAAVLRKLNVKTKSQIFDSSKNLWYTIDKEMDKKRPTTLCMEKTLRLGRGPSKPGWASSAHLCEYSVIE